MASTFRNAVLRATYTSYFTSKDASVGLKDITTEHALDEMIFHQEVENLTTAQYIRPWTAGRHYRITFIGIEYVEANELADSELVNKNQQARATILTYLRQRYESGQASGRAFLDQIIADNDLEPTLALRNVDMLLNQGFMQQSFKTYQITSQGLAATALAQA